MTPTYIIYRLTCTVNGKVYIGQTKNSLRQRLAEHLVDSRRGSGSMQNALALYGLDAFRAEIVEQGISEEDVDSRERHHVAGHRSNDRSFGYNLTDGGRGCKPSQASIAKLRKTLAESRSSPEYRAKISEANRKRWSDPAFKAKMSKSTRELWMNPEYADKIRSANTGFRHTKEAKEKISASHKGILLGRRLPESFKSALRAATAARSRGSDGRFA
jgi:group I intron endonuclease